LTCKKATAGSGGVTIGYGQTSGGISGSGATSDQSSFCVDQSNLCVDQSNPNLVMMYRKINACAVASKLQQTLMLRTAMAFSLVSMAVLMFRQLD
jgi:hypothetical protein